MNILKIGDRVIVVDDTFNSNYFKLGDKGTVVDVLCSESILYMIQFDEPRVEDGKWYAYANEVMKIEEGN